MSSQTTSLGPVLVIGGCGFIGYHIVEHLLLEPDCGPISVMSRNPTSITKLLAEVKPQVLFHTASPSASDPAITPEEHHNTIVNGTKNLLACATASPFVKALVYTSSASVIKNYEHINVDETAPLWKQDSKAIPYMKAKALADAAVREINTPLDKYGHGLLTAALRLPLVYGERDTQYIPAQLTALKAKQNKVQLGNGRNNIQPVYAGNAAIAHILAAKALVESVIKLKDKRVDGEAFLITDGENVPFWEFSRMTWRHAGGNTKMEEVTVVPGWLALALASTLEYTFAILTLGQVRPPLSMSRLFIQFTIYNTTYNIDKARERLGYKPVVDHDGFLKRSVEWELMENPDKWEDLTAVGLYQKY
ncbi:Sterol-4-alpha-carboxylate 3-dehydrogenase [Lachnellula suecica]|uniref:Sterol-4-alpha-carboxylate 3-dehydrogenase n=1 Tax=Lachnellula suecica TaxID=602035 RepID=A0A8T9C3K1_9HELO|nr:Sterol-4-alpha-carboxylate 3-dehydrogenase [Lachnellula suecica]